MGVRIQDTLSYTHYNRIIIPSQYADSIYGGEKFLLTQDVEEWGGLIKKGSAHEWALGEVILIFNIKDSD